MAGEEAVLSANKQIRTRTGTAHSLYTGLEEQGLDRKDKSGDHTAGKECRQYSHISPARGI